MKKIIPFFVVAILFAMPVAAQRKVLHRSADSTQQVQVVEASCGMCQFGMKSNDCSLAVRIKGKTYFVDGTGIDDHGDAHASDGFCQAIRMAEVKGKIVNGRFKATYFKLLPNEAINKKQ